MFQFPTCLNFGIPKQHVPFQISISFLKVLYSMVSQYILALISVSFEVVWYMVSQILALVRFDKAKTLYLVVIMLILFV